MTTTLEVYCGPMFASKTTQLLGRCSTVADLTGMPVRIYKPVIDTRYSVSDIKTHDGLSASELGLVVISKPSDWVISSEELAELKQEAVEFVAIDEAQFFDNADVLVCELMKAGVNVVCSGLDLDSAGDTFGKMGDLLCLATHVVKCTANCALCGNKATRTFRKLSAPSKSKVLVGGGDLYEARCADHWTEGMIEWKSWVE